MSLIILLDDTSGVAAPPPVVTTFVGATLAPPAGSALSSALGLADIALVWGSGDADLTVIDSDLGTEAGLETAVMLSLFTDRRCEDDDTPPSGDDKDRRGWWADQFAIVEGDKFGSRLWLLDRSTRTNEVMRRAEEYVREALAWMLEDAVVQSIDVAVETTSHDLLIAVELHRPGKDPVSLRFAHVWDVFVSGGGI